ncbi:MAG: hypothetical protein OXM58_02560 [Rhodospirillaceae bacterium]|nr:hypothetical protein [Rhodospirillaceae bacterium]MDE0618904.1 hypothetical protein [Rhodospirillaceae bacterium]
MSRVTEILRSLDRKERFAVLRETLGFDPTAPELGARFRTRLSTCIGVPVPAKAFVAMDYHLDWIQLALHLAEISGIAPGTAFANPDFEDFNADQEDIDLLLAFENGDAGRPLTHLVLIEAKAYLPWTNSQLASKTRRLGEIFGGDGTRHDTVEPHFVLMTERRSRNIQSSNWPGWTTDRNGEPFWLEYKLPCRRKVTRCDAAGRPDRRGDHLRLDRVPRPVG